MEKIQPEKVGETCPDCGGELVYRNGRHGRFISCLNFPKCKYTRAIETEKKEAPEPSRILCPECGRELLKRKSRYGTYFLGCSGFPSCRYMADLNGEKIVPKAKKTAKKSARGKK